MKANTEKGHVLLSGSNKLTANIDENVIESEDKQILLVITIDSNLSFNKHILLEYQVIWTFQNVG